MRDRMQYYDSPIQPGAVQILALGSHRRQTLMPQSYQIKSIHLITPYLNEVSLLSLALTTLPLRATLCVCIRECTMSVTKLVKKQLNEQSNSSFSRNNRVKFNCKTDATRRTEQRDIWHWSISQSYNRIVAWRIELSVVLSLLNLEEENSRIALNLNDPFVLKCLSSIERNRFTDRQEKYTGIVETSEDVLLSLQLLFLSCCHYSCYVVVVELPPSPPPLSLPQASLCPQVITALCRCTWTGHDTCSH